MGGGHVTLNTVKAQRHFVQLFQKMILNSGDLS